MTTHKPRKHHHQRTSAELAQIKADSADVAAANRAMLDSLKRTGKAASVDGVKQAVSAAQMVRTNAAFDDTFKKTPPTKAPVVQVKATPTTTNAFKQVMTII